MVRLYFLMLPAIVQAIKVSNFESIQSLYGPNDIITYEEKSSLFNCSLACQKWSNCVGFSIPDDNGYCEIAVAFPSINKKTKNHKSFRSLDFTEKFTENVALSKDAYVENEQARMTLDYAVDGKFGQHYTQCAVWVVQPVRQYIGIDLHHRYVISHGRVLSRNDNGVPMVLWHFVDVVVSVGDTRAAPDTLFDNSVCEKNVGGILHWNNFTCMHILTGRHVVLYRDSRGAGLTVCEIEIYGTLLSRWTNDQKS